MVTSKGKPKPVGKRKLEAAIPQIHPHGPKRLYLREHRRDKGVSAVAMGGRLGIERESVYRQEREWWRVGPADQLAWADALDIEPEALWSLPRPKKRPSMDALTKDASDDTYELALDYVRRLVANAKQ